MKPFYKNVIILPDEGLEPSTSRLLCAHKRLEVLRSIQLSQSGKKGFRQPQESSTTAGVFDNRRIRTCAGMTHSLSRAAP